MNVLKIVNDLDLDPDPEPLNLVDAAAVRSRRVFLSKTRKFLDHIKVKEWRPGEKRECRYEKVLFDFEIDKDDTKERSFLVTFRDNSHFLEVHEEYPKLFVHQVQDDNRDWWLRIEKVDTREKPLTSLCTPIKEDFILMPGNIKLYKGDIDLLTWAKLKNAQTDAKKLLVAPKVEHDDITIVDVDGNQLKVWEWDTIPEDLQQSILAVEKQPLPGTTDVFRPITSIELDPKGEWILRYEAEEAKKAEKAKEEVKKETNERPVTTGPVQIRVPRSVINHPEEAAEAEQGEIEILSPAIDTKTTKILTVAIGKVRAGETDIEKIVAEARDDAVRADVTDIEKLVTEVRTKVEEELGTTT